jgi:hypothetical protein
MIEPSLVDRPNGLVVGLLAQIDPAQLRADMLGQGDDLETGLCDHIHATFLGTFLGAFLGLSPAIAFATDFGWP